VCCLQSKGLFYCSPTVRGFLRWEGQWLLRPPALSFTPRRSLTWVFYPRRNATWQHCRCTNPPLPSGASQPACRCRPAYFAGGAAISVENVTQGRFGWAGEVGEVGFGDASVSVCHTEESLQVFAGVASCDMRDKLANMDTSRPSQESIIHTFFSSSKKE